jgi:RNA polymerase sigma-70 factor (ECF subfamily)
MDEHLATFKRIVNDDVQAYEVIFKAYYRFLCSFAFGLTKEKHSAEEIVEDFFVDLWRNRQKLLITTSVRSYFVNSIHHRCLNYLQREKPKFISTHDISSLIDKEGTLGDQLIAQEVPSILTNELEHLLAKAIEKLPNSCREIFLLSRFQDLSYEEISLRQNVSVNTVKTQIKIALSKLREDLKNYITVFLLFIF